MTDQAQTELLRIFDIILQSDIRIIKECKTLQKVWGQVLNRDANLPDAAQTAVKTLLKNEVLKRFHENFEVFGLPNPQNTSKRLRCQFHEIFEEI